tara:strand:+ start:36 stop:452 length:417 start_codon:yes stop_codon:yes gene_type:complete
MKKLTRIFTIVALSIFCFSTNAQIVDGVRLKTIKLQVWEVDLDTREYELFFEHNSERSFLLSNKEFWMFKDGKPDIFGKWEYKENTKSGNYKYDTEDNRMYLIHPDYEMIMSYHSWDDNLSMFKTVMCYIVDHIEHIK